MDIEKVEQETQTMPSVSIDMPDGVTHSITKIEDYLKKLLMWGRILLVSVLGLAVFAILVYNFFAPSEKDVSPKVIQNLLHALNAQGLIDIPPIVLFENQTEWGTTSPTN